jgi:hypothetical protein
MAASVQRITYLRGIVVLLIAACTGDVRSGEQTRTSLDAAGATTGVNAEAEPEAQFSRFLSLSIATRERNLVYTDSVYTDGDIQVAGDVAPCLAGDETVSRWLADFHVLSMRTHGDSAEATAAITSAAREVEEPDAESFVVIPQIQEDTATWKLLNTSGTNDKWMVCGPGSDRKEIFGLSKVGRTIKWPNGGSQQSVMKTIDSVRRSRGLPIAR